MPTIRYELERDEDLFELEVEGTYDSGEPEGRWGRYGASPGSPEDVEITTVSEVRVVLGPHVSPLARGPVTYWLPFELHSWEEEAIRDALLEQARFDIEAAQEAAAEDAYEERYGSF